LAVRLYFSPRHSGHLFVPRSVSLLVLLSNFFRRVIFLVRPLLPTRRAVFVDGVFFIAAFLPWPVELIRILCRANTSAHPMSRSIFVGLAWGTIPGSDEVFLRPPFSDPAIPLGTACFAIFRAGWLCCFPFNGPDLAPPSTTWSSIFPPPA